MNAPRALRGRLARQSGRRSEWLAAALLMAKGYRILGFRLAAPGAEIDLVAMRGGVLAVVEVKRRATLQAAIEAVSLDQRQRLLRAGLKLAATQRRLSPLAVRLDLIALAPGRAPRHIAGAWEGETMGQ